MKYIVAIISLFVIISCGTPKKGYYTFNTVPKEDLEKYQFGSDFRDTSNREGWTEMGTYRVEWHKSLRIPDSNLIRSYWYELSDSTDTSGIYYNLWDTLPHGGSYYLDTVPESYDEVDTTEGAIFIDMLIKYGITKDSLDALRRARKPVVIKIPVYLPPTQRYLDSLKVETYKEVTATLYKGIHYRPVSDTSYADPIIEDYEKRLAKSAEALKTERNIRIALMCLVGGIILLFLFLWLRRNRELKNRGYETYKKL